MKNLIYLLLLILFCSCESDSKNSKNKLDRKNQEKHFRELSYLIHIKNEVGKRNWKGITQKNLFQPLVYYTYDGTFVINPNEHIKKITEHKEVKTFEGEKVIKLSEKYTDTLNFNFTTSYIDTDSTTLYYKENVLFFQSFDLTEKLIGVNDLQDWSVMVIHELFHGYQRSIPEFKVYSSSLDIPGGPDQYLGKLHKEESWFKKSIELENEILKDIWINDADVSINLKKYDSIRTKRIDRVKALFGVDIREVEDYEILMEGHARYFESLCKRHLSENESDISMLNDSDLKGIAGIFDGYKIKKDKFLYNIYNDRYYYPIGYNISMILEKHLPIYKESVYRKEYNFNSYLRTLMKGSNETK